MILGCIADDFTGAADLASILAAERMATTLLADPAAIDRAEGDAVVIALKTRSVPAAEAVARSLAALEALKARGCQQIFFKYCSTFDSTPLGNIGPVAEALAAALGIGPCSPGVIVCPAFPANARTLYQGNLFVGDVPLAESGMRDHPLTPMRDSDIRRWLSLQTNGAVRHVAHPLVRRGVDAVRAALVAASGLVVVDAIDDADLRTIGAAARGAPLVTGGSAVAMGLPDNFRAEGLIGEAPLPVRGVVGPALVIAGSCSTMTNTQVARYRMRAPSFEIDVGQLLAGGDVAGEACGFLAAHLGEAPLIYSTAPPAQSQAFVGPDGANRAAEAIEALLAGLAEQAVALGVRRLVVAGGETSGAVMSRLGIGALAVGQTIAPGVPVLAAGGLAVALKSGNFGDEDFFAKAIAALGRDDG